MGHSEPPARASNHHPFNDAGVLARTNAVNSQLTPLFCSRRGKPLLPEAPVRRITKSSSSKCHILFGAVRRGVRRGNGRRQVAWRDDSIGRQPCRHSSRSFLDPLGPRSSPDRLPLPGHGRPPTAGRGGSNGAAMQIVPARIAPGDGGSNLAGRRIAGCAGPAADGRCSTHAVYRPRLAWRSPGQLPTMYTERW
ncbi:hypothetical protein HBB16_19825 [Pseudonocardia sp. MCCB 268]|nr:hypothetical protein [Pseudonocardia cytotoxica]